MIKINIKKSDGSIGWSAVWNTQEKADAWIAQEVANNSWGKPERWVREEDEDISEALETREVENLQGPIIEYKLAAEYTIEQIDLGNEPLMEALRSQRNQLLQQCDWTQLADSPLSNESKSAWASYRQALRDLPENCEDPSNPQWPQEPEV